MYSSACVSFPGVVKDVPLLIKEPIAESSSELGAARSYISPIGRHAFTEALGAMGCHGMPWDAMGCHGMPQIRSDQVVDSVILVDPEGSFFSLMRVRLHTGPWDKVCIQKIGKRLETIVMIVQQDALIRFDVIWHIKLGPPGVISTLSQCHRGYEVIFSDGAREVSARAIP